jgi:hypothetical protein
LRRRLRRHQDGEEADGHRGKDSDNMGGL